MLVLEEREKKRSGAYVRVYASCMCSEGGKELDKSKRKGGWGVLEAGMRRSTDSKAHLGARLSARVMIPAVSAAV